MGADQTSVIWKVTKICVVYITDDNMDKEKSVTIFLMVEINVFTSHYFDEMWYIITEVYEYTVYLCRLPLLLKWQDIMIHTVN